MDPKFRICPHLWGALAPYGPQIWDMPSFMGCPGPIWTPILGNPLIYGVSWPPMDPKSRGSHTHPTTRGSPLFGEPWANVDPKTWGFMGHPGLICTPKSWGSPSPTGGPSRPQIWGSPSCMGCPAPTCTPKVEGPPLICRVFWSHKHPKTWGSPPSPSGPPRVPQKMGGPMRTPKILGPPPSPIAVPWVPWTRGGHPKSWGSHS